MSSHIYLPCADLHNGHIRRYRRILGASQHIEGRDEEKLLQHRALKIGGFNLLVTYSSYFEYRKVGY